MGGQLGVLQPPLGEALGLVDGEGLEAEHLATQVAAQGAAAGVGSQPGPRGRGGRLAGGGAGGASREREIPNNKVQKL